MVGLWRFGACSDDEDEDLGSRTRRSNSTLQGLNGAHSPAFTMGGTSDALVSRRVRRVPAAPTRRDGGRCLSPLWQFDPVSGVARRRGSYRHQYHPTAGARQSEDGDRGVLPRARQSDGGEERSGSLAELAEQRRPPAAAPFGDGTASCSTQGCPMTARVAMQTGVLTRLWHARPNGQLRRRHCAGCLWGGGVARALPRARAPNCFGCVRSMPYGRALHEREADLLQYKGCAPTCQPRRPLWQPACACSALVRHCAGCLWGGGAARALPRARAPNCFGCVRSMPYGRALHEREAALLRYKAVLPRASRGGHFDSRLARLARLCVTVLAVSGEEAQHARLSLVRVPNWAGCVRPMPYGWALHEREAALVRCKACSRVLAAAPTSPGGLRV